MAASEDSRPFTVLRQNAEDFKASFDENVTQCLDTLNSKITQLLVDQGSASSSFGDARRLNAHMEFSKAKLEVFSSMKDMLNEMEASWIEQLSELKETFVENIEIFLAGTKLEMKDDSLSRVGNRKSLSSLKGRKSYQNTPSPTVSSLYPTLINTAKHIPVINILLAKNDEQENGLEQHSIDSTPQNLKPIRKLSTSPPMKDTPGQNARKKNSVRFMEVENTETIIVDDDNEMEDEIEEIAVVETSLQKRGGRGFKKATVSTPSSAKKAPAVIAVQKEVVENDIVPVGTPVRPGRGSRKSILSTPASLKKSQAGTPLRRRNAAENRKESSDSSSSDDKSVSTPLRRRNVSEIIEASSDSSDDKPDEVFTTVPTVEVVPEIKTRRGTRSSQAETAVNSTPGKQKKTPARRGRQAKNQPVVPEPEVEISEESDSNKVPSPGGPKTPKNVHFSLGLDINEDLEIYSPQIDLTRSAPRRKTTVNPVLDPLPDFSLTPDVIRAKSKRKTIAGDISEISAAPSPKRLRKSASRSSIAPSTLVMDTNKPHGSDHLDDDEASGKANYTPWIPLYDVGAKVPTLPGVYELKVSQAKKPAFIGSCESLRQRLTLHKLKHNSGHKHLDKFVERNAVNILVRYELMPSIGDAKTEERIRINAFVSQFKTTPAYN